MPTVTTPTPVFRDAVHVGVTTDLSWVDRIKLLFGAKLHTRVVTRTENEVGRTETEAVVSTSLNWLDRRPRPQGQVADTATAGK